MTEIDGRVQTRRRWTWNARGQGNRITYALVFGWIAWLLLGQPAAWVGLPFAAAFYLAETVFFVVRDRRASPEST